MSRDYFFNHQVYRVMSDHYQYTRARATPTTRAPFPVVSPPPRALVSHAPTPTGRLEMSRSERLGLSVILSPCSFAR
jgi:hypothetical protein